MVADYRRAAQRANEAGFDGLEIHAANGYLIDPFLQSKTNRRNDPYGGSVENRLRFLQEIVEAVLTVWPAGRVGVRLARFKNGWPLAPDAPMTAWSAPTATGYTDFPVYAGK